MELPKYLCGRCRFQLAFILILIIYSEVSKVSARSVPCDPNDPCNFKRCYKGKGKVKEIKCYECGVWLYSGEDRSKCQMVKENQLEPCSHPDPVCTIFFESTGSVHSRECSTRKCEESRTRKIKENEYFICETDKCNDKAGIIQDYNMTTTTSTAKMTTTIASTAKLNSNVGRLDLNVV